MGGYLRDPRGTFRSLAVVAEAKVYPTISVPWLPASRWPGNEQKKTYSLTGRLTTGPEMLEELTLNPSAERVAESFAFGVAQFPLVCSISLVWDGASNSNGCCGDLYTLVLDRFSSLGRGGRRRSQSNDRLAAPTGDHDTGRGRGRDELMP